MAGEVITSPLPAVRLDVIDESVPSPPGVIAWGQAHRYVGQRVTVEGKIVDTYNHQGRIVFLNFDKNWQGKFYIPVFNEVFDDFPRSPEKYLLGKTLRITGKVSLHRDRPNIEVHDRGQIEIVR
jgi:hypothetical protein